MAVHRVLRLLQLLASPNAPLSLSTLSSSLSVPKPSLLSLLNELAMLGYVRRTPQAFELGPLAYRLGLQIVAVDSVSGIIRNALIELNARLKMTVACGYLDWGQKALIYADRYETVGPVRYIVPLGTPLSIHSRALGKLLLAYEPACTWKTWLGQEPYKTYTRRTLTEYVSVAKELETIKGTGMAITLSEQHEGIAGCAIPIYGEDGQPACGLAVQTPNDALVNMRADVISCLRLAAERLEKEFAARRIVRENLCLYV